MDNNRGRQSFSVVLVFGAMVFGMVLAGGMDLTPVSQAESTPAFGQPVKVAVQAGGMPSFADLAEAVSPAVVSVQATKIERARDMRGRGGNDPFEFFFGPRRRAPQSPQGEPEDRRSDSSGSGFVISADGYVVTNHHVIEGASGLTVILNGRQYPAEVKGDDPATDLALLKIETDEELAYLPLADSDEVRVGDWIMVIGSPLRLQNSVSVGVVSAKGRSINITPDQGLENFIQTDAAINFGNSGGPLVDLSGAVIGIATAINYGAENIGFAVPANTLKGILPQLRERGSVRRGYLGVAIDDLDLDEAEAFGLDSTDGALISEVREGPSLKAGLQHGDVILKVDGTKIANNRELIDNISSRQPGETVELSLFRAGKTIKKKVTLGERPSDQGSIVTPPAEDEGDIEWLGIRYQDITPGLRSNHQIPDRIEGVMLMSVAPDSPLYEENVRAGDIVVDVNGESVDSVAEFEQRVESVKSGAILRLYVTRVDPRSGQSVSFFAITRVP